jgi:hypothetical protein
MSQILNVKINSTDVLRDYDGLRCIAFANAMLAGETGVCLVLLEIPSTEPIRVVVNMAQKEASVVLPLPEAERSFDFGTAFLFPAGWFVVTEQTAQQVLPDLRAAMPEVETVYIVTLDPETAHVTLTCCVPEKPPVFVARKVEAAAAAAMVLHRDLSDGTMEQTIGQRGGILEIGLRKQGGMLIGLSAGGPVEVKV